MSDADYSTGVPECEEAAYRGNKNRGDTGLPWMRMVLVWVR